MIRPATASDVPALHALVCDLARYERLEDEVTSTPEQLSDHLFGARRYAEALVAQEDASVVGFALFFHNYSTFVGRPGLYLEDLFVRPESRRKGRGRALFREVARIAAERECGRFEWSVLYWNEPALAFYRSMGAVPMHDWRICRMTGEALARLALE
jgi:GNAT superfamily N-acetyltransferase